MFTLTSDLRSTRYFFLGGGYKVQETHALELNSNLGYGVTPQVPFTPNPLQSLRKC